MISSADVPTKFTWEKNFATDMTYSGVLKKHQVSAQGFDATKGLGQNTANSTTASLVPCPPSAANMRLTFRGQFGSFTTTANSNFGMFFRTTALEDITTPDNDGYYVRVVNGQARITRCTDATRTDLTTSAFPCVADEVVEIVVTLTGSAIHATFENQTSNPGVLVTLTATDSTYTYGFVGFRSLAATIWCRYFKVEEL